jgi:hypothetical protein
MKITLMAEEVKKIVHESFWWKETPVAAQILVPLLSVVPTQSI